MRKKVLINEYAIDANNFQKEVANRRKISFTFTVTHNDYHDITTLLYKNDFIVNVPTENLQFAATITNYSTSITNLYEEGAVGTFQLELTEIS